MSWTTVTKSRPFVLLHAGKYMIVEVHTTKDNHGRELAQTEVVLDPNPSEQAVFAFLLKHPGIYEVHETEYPWAENDSYVRIDA